MKHRGIGHSKVRYALEAIEARYAHPDLTIASIAAECDIVSSSLSAAFSRFVGVTFAECLRNVRLDRAAARLKTSTQSIKSVWSAVGYNDHSNFYHDFRRRFGVTPRKYRLAVTDAPMLPLFTTVDAGAAAQLSNLPAAEENGGRVLIVDDDEVGVKAIGRGLEIGGYRVGLAATGNEGLRMLNLFSPDVVLLDYHLPDTNALEWLSAARGGCFQCGLPVAVMTADWFVEDLRERFDELHALVQFKPISLDEVEGLVALLIEKSSSLFTGSALS